MKILLIEDDAAIAASLITSLQSVYHLDWADTIKAAQNEIHVNHYNCIVADLQLPDGNCMDFCRQLRAKENHTPFLIITGNQAQSKKIEGLLSGADDYLTKPFLIAELQARIHAILRRGTSYIPDDLTFGKAIIDRINRTLSVEGSIVTLTRKEFDLLLFLAEHIEKPVAMTLLIESLWDSKHEPISNTIEVHICQLRKKFRTFHIQLSIHTLKNYGYLLSTQA